MAAHPILRAVLFDFDGVIADTEALHFSTLADTLAEEGLFITQEDYNRTYIVLDDRNAIRAAFDHAKRPLDDERLKTLMNRKARLFEETMRTGVPLFPGVVACIRSLAAQWPLAIASGALKAEIEAILNGHGLADAFTGIVAADDVRHGKPHPETYLRAGELLRRAMNDPEPLRESECLVIEDTINGIAGAKAAGMRVLAVANSYPAERLTQADAVVSSLEGITPAVLRELLASK